MFLLTFKILLRSLSVVCTSLADSMSLPLSLFLLHILGVSKSGVVAPGFPQRDVRHSGSCQALTQRTNEMWELAVLKLIRDRHTLKAEWLAVWRLYF